jgi:outer membrane translocation and assembly module TamA
LKHRSRHTAATLALIVVGGAGCASIPQGRAAIDSVRIVGAKAVDPADIEDKLATVESPKFLGLLRGVAFDYSIFDDSVLQRDLARVERYYHGRGFFEAHARVARVVHVSDDHVRVEIVVEEGQPVRNGAAVIAGAEGLPAPVAGAVHSAIDSALPRGERFDENAYRQAQTAALRALTDRGYAYATAQADAHVDLATHVVDYAFGLKPGIGALFGPVSFVGLDPDAAGPMPQEIEDAPLLRAMHIRTGRPFSTAQIETATQALLDLEVFSAVHVVPTLSDPPRPVVPLVVEVEPTKLRTLRLGGGGEFDEIKTDAHLLVGWEDHNLLGGLRDLSIDLKPGVVFYPTNFSNFRAPTDYFPEERLRFQFRQPGFLESRTNGFIQTENNIYPLLVESTARDTVVGYVEPKISVGVDRRLERHLFAKLIYNLQGEIPIKYKGDPPSLPPKVLLSFPQLVAQLDFKDDPIHPHAGFAADLDFQIAGLGGTASDVRIQPDVEGYIPIAHGVTLALSGTLGLLFPLDYGGSVERLPESNASASDIQTIYFRGFFSGGPNSNRGYPLRGVSPHGYVPFLNPATAIQQAANGCDPNHVMPGQTLPQDNPLCSSPIGGFTQWETSAEVRTAISGPFGAVVFCDAGDVSQFVLTRKPDALRFRYLHMSCGVGARYDTPVGPIRLDIGYRIQPLQVIGQRSETAVASFDTTQSAPPTILGQPLGVAFGIGESF